MDMTVRVTCRYSKVMFGYERIDDDAELLRDIVYYSVTLHRSILKMAGSRHDVILAILEEDPATVFRCTPFISLFNTQILLVQLVMRAELANIVIRQVKAGIQDRFNLMSAINQVRGSIGRISYANGDRTDCTRSNIREL